MKTRLLLPLAIALAAACPLAAEVEATSADQPSSAQQGDWGKKMREKMRERMENAMTPEIRKRFEAAREKALQDPSVQALKAKAEASNEEFRKAMRAAMLKADPELAELIKKYGQDKNRPPGMGKDAEAPLAEFPEADRKKLMAARQQAANDPAVKAAEEKKSAASTPEDRRTAAVEYHAAMKAAMLKADPSIEPLLEKLKELAKQKRDNRPDKKGDARPGDQTP